MYVHQGAWPNPKLNLARAWAVHDNRGPLFLSSLAIEASDSPGDGSKARVGIQRKSTLVIQKLFAYSYTYGKDNDGVMRMC